MEDPAPAPQYGTLKLVLIMSFGLFSVLASGTNVFLPWAILLFDALKNSTMFGLLYTLRPGEIPFLKK